MLRDDGRLLNELSLYRDPFSPLIVAFCSVISNLYAFFFFRGHLWCLDEYYILRVPTVG